MITLEHVKKTFNKHHKNSIKAIDDTSIKLGDNNLVALLGASGSGKTTLLNMIGGLDKPNKGKIFIDNKRITKVGTYKRDKIRNLKIGYIFQDYKLIDNLSVFDNVALVLKMQGLKNKNEIKLRVNYVLETLGIYRFRNRPAEMLSGGERQRVGIARAIVKDPEIIIADEPTGNLDSKNSLEIMNIIKCISKTRLVILVTHETTLANFFASRIIEIEDGKVIKDYENKNSDDLDYRLENNIYLKDIKNHEIIDTDNNIDIYKETKEKLNLTLVVRNGNIYIKSNDKEKIEVLDDNSSIELINDHYKKMTQEESSKYEFNFSKVINNNYKKRYSSIYNPITLLINGFKKMGNYSVMKKILLLGFMIASMFIVFSISRIFATFNIKDSDFVTYNKTYIDVKKNKISMDDYNAIKSVSGINYIIPTDSFTSFEMHYDTYLQNYNRLDVITPSLASTSIITNKDLLYGRMPLNDYEIVIDKSVLSTLRNNSYLSIESGLIDYKDFMNIHLKLKNMNDFIIVGMTDIGSPSLYASSNILINMLSNTNDYSDNNTEVYLDYNIKPDYVIKKGRMPLNDYEVALNYTQKDAYALNKTINNKINNHKLTVVGFYQTTDSTNAYLVNNNMILSNLLNKKNIMISSNDKNDTITKLNLLGYNGIDTYINSKNEYQKANQKNTKSIIVVSCVMIAISLIEIFLMIRSSFLSRIKEIGTYRAIGVKKGDIYKMFLGEILAISLTASNVGIILMSYIVYNLEKMPYIGSLFLINGKIIILSYVVCFGFNILVGLIPVYNVIRKTPAAILSRHDI